MKKAMRVPAAGYLFAIFVAVTLAGPSSRAETQGAVQGNGQDRELQQLKGHTAKASSKKDRLAGVWNATVVLTDCSSGSPIGDPFDAMALFERDGSFHDTNANNPTVMLRSDAFGYWKHVRGNKYRFAFRVFNFDSAGMYLGYQIVRHDVILSKDGKSYTSKGGAEFYNPDGSERPPVQGCSESTATRFK